MEENEMAPVDYIGILKRRKVSLVIPALIVFLIAALVGLLLPSIYKSSSTLLIEAQEIPADYVHSTVTSFAEQRIQQTNQRIMSSSKLLEIIKEFDLYTELVETWTSDEIIEKMREDIKLEPVSVEVVDQRSGKLGAVTIAFTISYEGKQARKVQQVATKMTSLFLEEDLQVLSRGAEDASNFLEDEKNKLKVQLEAAEKRLADFKEEHFNELPELLQVHMQQLNNIERQIDTVDAQIRSLREQKGYIEAQLVSVNPSGNAEDQRLDQLQIALATLKSKFSDEHPDVIKIKAEIAEVEKNIEQSKATGTDLKQPNNPAWITLSSQLASAEAELDSYREQRKKLYKDKEDYNNRIAATPRVAEEYNSIMSELKSIQAKHDDLLLKLMESKVAHGLQKEQKGERFTLIDPARLPEKPYKPNRIAIVLIGLVLGIGAGVGTASLMEFSDSSVRNATSLSLATSFPVLSTIPVIVTEKDLARKKKKRLAVIAGTIVALIAGITIFHFFVMDLDIFQAKVLRKTDKIMTR